MIPKTLVTKYTPDAVTFNFAHAITPMWSTIPLTKQ